MPKRPAIPQVRSGSWDISPFTAMSTSFPNAIGIEREIREDAKREEIDFT
jgi:hypothetical protein